MTNSNTHPPAGDPPAEAPMPSDPDQDPSVPENPQPTDPAESPFSPEEPERDNPPEDPEPDPFDEGNFPI